MTAVTPLHAHTRATFVRDSVQEIPLTTKIIDQIMPFFPKRCLCIAGHLDDGAQFWKVNYHWDLLVYMIDKLLARPDCPPAARADAAGIKDALMANAPNPKTGYRTDKNVGDTVDSSSAEQVVKRHATLRQAKKDFEKVIAEAGVVDPASKAAPPTDHKAWWLAVAPVAKPGTSKHGSGFALDIEGDNEATTKIAKALGATLVFNEASHVHVEFAEGVRLP